MTGAPEFSFGSGIKKNDPVLTRIDSRRCIWSKKWTGSGDLAHGYSEG